MKLLILVAALSIVTFGASAAILLGPVVSTPPGVTQADLKP